MLVTHEFSIGYFADISAQGNSEAFSAHVVLHCLFVFLPLPIAMREKKAQATARKKANGTPQQDQEGEGKPQQE